MAWAVLLFAGSYTIQMYTYFGFDIGISSDSEAICNGLALILWALFSIAGKLEIENRRGE